MIKFLIMRDIRQCDESYKEAMGIPLLEEFENWQNWQDTVIDHILSSRRMRSSPSFTKVQGSYFGIIGVKGDEAGGY